MVTIWTINGHKQEHTLYIDESNKHEIISHTHFAVKIYETICMTKVDGLGDQKHLAGSWRSYNFQLVEMPVF